METVEHRLEKMKVRFCFHESNEQKKHLATLFPYANHEKLPINPISGEIDFNYGPLFDRSGYHDDEKDEDKFIDSLKCSLTDEKHAYQASTSVVNETLESIYQ